MSIRDYGGMLTDSQRRFAYQISKGATIKDAADFVDITLDTATAWLNDPEISEVLLADKRAALTVALTTRERVLADIISLSQSNIADYYEPGSGWQALRDLESLTEEQQKRIQSVEWTQHGPKLKLYDRSKALNDVAKYLGLDNVSAEDQRPDELANMLRAFAAAAEKATTGAD